MKKTTTLILGTLGTVALAAGCGMETAEAPPEQALATERAAVCSNSQAVNVVFAGLAASAALEMRRWLPERDFVFVNGVLSLSPYAYPRCPGRNCRQTQSWLNLQSWAAQGEIIGGEALDVGALRSRIAAQWQRQMTCNNRPDNHAGDDCPVEHHDLVFSARTPGTCGDDLWFHAYKAGTTNALQYPQQLRNKLIWAGYPDNPLLAFDAQGDDVKIDPIEPPTGGGGSGSGNVYMLAATSPNPPYCGAIPAGGAAVLGAPCQCMTSPPQPVYTFKAALIAGWLKCKP